MHQMFFVRTTPGKFENAAITGHFRFVFEGNSDKVKSRDYRDFVIIEQLRFQNVFRPHQNAQPAFFTFLRFEERFRKARSVFVALTAEIKLRFLISPA